MIAIRALINGYIYSWSYWSRSLSATFAQSPLLATRCVEDWFERSETILFSLQIGNNNKITMKDIEHLTRDDPVKSTRVKDLLMKRQELKKARRTLDDKMGDL